MLSTDLALLVVAMVAVVVAFDARISSAKDLCEARSVQLEQRIAALEAVKSAIQDPGKYTSRA